MQSLCIDGFNTFCMHRFRVSKLDLPISSLTQTLVVQARDPEIHHTPQYNSTVQCGRARCHAYYAMRHTEPISFYASTRAVFIENRQVWADQERFSASAIFYVLLHNAQTWTEFGALCGVQDVAIIIILSDCESCRL